MADEIKDSYSASVAFTITLAALASSTAGVGRQSTIIDNSTTRYQDILVYIKFREGINPTSNRAMYVYLIRTDDIGAGTVHRTDGAGAADAGITIHNAPVVGVIADDGTAATGEDYYGEFLIHRPGPEWGIAIVHDTGVDLDADAADHWARWIGLNPEVQ